MRTSRTLFKMRCSHLSRRTALDVPTNGHVMVTAVQMEREADIATLGRSGVPAGATNRSHTLAELG